MPSPDLDNILDDSNVNENVIDANPYEKHCNFADDEFNDTIEIVESPMGSPRLHNGADGAAGPIQGTLKDELKAPFTLKPQFSAYDAQENTPNPSKSGRKKISL